MKPKPNIYAAAFAQLRELVSDLGVVAGAAGITYGAWLYAHPLGYIVGGGLLSVGSFLAGYERRRVRSVSK